MSTLKQPVGAPPLSPQLKLDNGQKRALKDDIEAGLQAMFDEANQQLNDELAKGHTDPKEQEHITASHLATLETIRQLAEEQRRWASGAPASSEGTSKAVLESESKIKTSVPVPTSTRLLHTNSSKSSPAPSNPQPPRTHDRGWHVQEFWKPSITPQEGAMTLRKVGNTQSNPSYNPDWNSMASRSPYSQRSSISTAPSIFSLALTDPLEALLSDNTKGGGGGNGSFQRASIYSVDEGYPEDDEPGDKDWRSRGYIERRRRAIEERLRKRKEGLTRMAEDLAREAEELKLERAVRKQQGAGQKYERPRGSTKQGDDEAKRKEAGLWRKEEDINRKEKEVSLREQEVRRLVEDMRKREEELTWKELEVKKKELDAKNKEEEAKRMVIDARRRQEMARWKEEELRKREKELKRREETLNKGTKSVDLLGSGSPQTKPSRSEPSFITLQLPVASSASHARYRRDPSPRR